MKFIKFLKKFWLLILIGFLIGGGIVWFSGSAKAKSAEANKYTVKKDNLVETVSLSGEIDAEEKASLRFQTSGYLTWVGVKEGDYVKKYQSLASLDKKDLQNSMSKLLNTYSKTRWDFEQAQDDNKDWQTEGMTDEARTAIKRTLDKYQFDLNNSVLSVESQALALKYATLWTPIEGIVTSVESPMAGQNITPATATFDVVNPKTIYFSATADQTEVVSFAVGMKGRVSLDSFPDTDLTGEIVSVGFVPKTGEASTVYEIKIAVDTTSIGDKIKMGMTGDASFVLKEIKDVLVVPESYLKKDGDKYYVTVDNGKTKTKTEVTVGEAVEGLVEIRGGLNEKDVIYNQPK